MKYFLPTLCLIFITLKLTNYIDWSWWYVTAPIWGPLVLVVAFYIVMFSVIGFCNVVIFFTTTKEERERQRSLEKLTKSLGRLAAYYRKN